MTSDNPANAVANHIYRNADVGAEARRDDLLTRQRADHALVSLELRRIFVRRTARIITGVVAACGGLAIAVANWNASFYAELARWLPGLESAVVATLVSGATIAAAIAYFAAQAWAEERFTRAMSRAIRPSNDLYRDLDRLAHEQPSRIAHTMAARLEVASVTLPLIGATLLGPWVALYLVEGLINVGFPGPSQLEAQIHWLQHELLGLPQILYTVLSWTAAQHLAATPTIRLNRPARYAAGASCVTSAFGLGFLPSPHLLMVGLAGLAFSVAMLIAAARIRRERRHLAR